MAIQFQREHGSMGTAVRDRDADAQEAQLRRAARQHARCWRGGRAGRRAVLLKPLKPDSCMHVCHCSHRVYCFTKRSGASTKIGSCCFPSGLLTYAGTVVPHVDENRLSHAALLAHLRGIFGVCAWMHPDAARLEACPARSVYAAAGARTQT